MTRLRTLIVEDQAASRDRLVTLLSAEPDVEVVAACGTGDEAVELIRSAEPDLVLLDLQLPGLDGFGVIETVGLDRMPMTIFVTAYDEFALRAFDVHAFDYLLKPFSRERLRETLDRAHQHLQAGREERLARRLLSLVRDLRPPAASDERFLVRSGGRILFVSHAEIDYVESEGNYVRLHTGGRSHLIRETMASIEQRLGEARFCRVHRTRIVNLDRVRELQVTPTGEHEIVTVDEQRFRVGRAYRDTLQTRLQLRV